VRVLALVVSVFPFLTVTSRVWLDWVRPKTSRCAVRVFFTSRLPVFDEVTYLSPEAPSGPSFEVSSWLRVVLPRVVSRRRVCEPSRFSPTLALSERAKRAMSSRTDLAKVARPFTSTKLSSAFQPFRGAGSGAAVAGESPDDAGAFVGAAANFLCVFVRLSTRDTASPRGLETVLSRYRPPAGGSCVGGARVSSGPYPSAKNWRMRPRRFLVSLASRARAAWASSPSLAASSSTWRRARSSASC